VTAWCMAINEYSWGWDGLMLGARHGGSPRPAAEKGAVAGAEFKMHLSLL
jgi:hypothetical protein